MNGTEGRRRSPLVSVIVPAYNAHATVQRSVESLLQQSLDDIEIVVVNDGSTDSTASVVAALAAEDARVCVIDRRENRGLVFSLQEGLTAARAPLIARLDADDTAHRERLERQVRSFQDPAVVLCATAYRRVRRDGALIRESHPPAAHAAMAAALLDGNRICHSSVMFRLDAARSVGGYRAEWYPVEDYDLWLRLMEVGRYTGIDEPLVDYLENEAGVSSTNTGLQGARLDERRAQYRASVLNADRSPAGSPRTAATARRRLHERLASRGIDTAGLDAQCYSMAVSGPGPTWRRRLRMLAAPRLVWRGLRG